MSTWSTHTNVTGTRDGVIAVLSDPEAIRRWSAFDDGAATEVWATPTNERNDAMLNTTALEEPAIRQQSQAPAVAAVDVTRRFGEGDSTVDALRGVTLHVPRGQFTAVMGPSGSGKSTLMHILAGLDRPTSGTVAVAGQQIGTLADNELTRLRRDHVGFVFQFFNLLPMLTAEENILLPAQIAGRDLEPGRLDEVLAEVGLTDRRDHRPSQLSGGQQQRVAIARALIGRPTVLFADEPTGNLDSRTGEEILGLIRSSVDSYGQTTVMVTHDPSAAATADRVLFLADGLIVSDLDRPSRAEVIAGLEEVTNR